MENKISLPGLAAMLALSTGRQKDLCENFLREFFKIIEEELCAGENVRVKGFGSFKLVDVEPRRSVNVSTGEEYEIPGHKKVIFVAANELSSLVNQAFGAFEAVEIDDALPTDILEGELPEDIDKVLAEESVQEEEEDYATEEAYSAAEQPGDDKGDDRPENEDVGVDDKPVDEESCADDAGEGDAGENEEKTDDDAEESYPDRKDGKSGYFAKGFVAGILSAVALVAAAFAIAWFSGWLRNDNGLPDKPAESRLVITETVSKEDVSAIPDDKKDVVQQDSVPSEAEGNVETVPSDAPVYDVVTTTRYLTTIAKEHYGNFNLWPIIYEENQSILGHPDRIRPGTKVVVPPLSKYGVDPHNAAHIKEIKQKGTAIYARFK